MANINKLRGKIIEAGKNVENLAGALGMDRSTMYRRLSENGDTFTVREVNAIINELKLSPKDAASIFFTHNVA